jgi:hypothetical protein
MRNQRESFGIASCNFVPNMGDFNDDLRVCGKDALRRSLLTAMKKQGQAIEGG